MTRLLSRIACWWSGHRWKELMVCGGGWGLAKRCERCLKEESL